MIRTVEIAVISGLLLFLPTTALGINEWESEDGDVYVSLIGAERLIGAFYHVPNEPLLYPDGDDGLFASVTRLILDGMVGAHIKLELNTFLDISRQPFANSDGTFATAAGFDTPYRTRYLTGLFWEDDAITGNGGIDRISAKVTFDPVTLTIGRFPINHSVTHIFAPNDYFAPFSTTAVNTMYKPGVDAATLTWAAGQLSIVELIAVLGHDIDDAPTFSRSALLLHAQTVLLEVELALHGGKVADRWVAGGSVQASTGRFNIRGEGHVGFPDTNGDFKMDDIDGDGRTEDGFHARLSVGVDTFFTWHNSTLGLEYLYLSDGASHPSEYLERAGRFFPDDPAFLGRHYLGATAATEIIPVLKGMVMGLLNAESPSGLVMATLVYSISDEADFVVGGMIPIGKSPVVHLEGVALKSEYGHAPQTFFVESRFYF